VNKKFKAIVEYTFDHCFKNNLPLIYNCIAGNYEEALRLLTDRKIDPTAHFDYLALTTDPSILNILLNDKRIIEMKNIERYLEIGALNGNINFIIEMLKNSSYNILPEYFYRSCCITAHKGFHDILQLLLDDSRLMVQLSDDKFFKTLIAEAVFAGKKSLKILIDHSKTKNLIRNFTNFIVLCAYIEFEGLNYETNKFIKQTFGLDNKVVEKIIMDYEEGNSEFRDTENYLCFWLMWNNIASRVFNQGVLNKEYYFVDKKCLKYI